MKKIISILAACATLLVVSCNKDNHETSEPVSDFDPTSLKAFNVYTLSDYKSVADTINSPNAVVYLYETYAQFKESFNELTSDPEMTYLYTVVQIAVGDSVKTHRIWHAFESYDGVVSAPEDNAYPGPWCTPDANIILPAEIIVCKPEAFTFKRDSKTITVVDYRVIEIRNELWIEDCPMAAVPTVSLEKAFNLVQMRDKEMPDADVVTLREDISWRPTGKFGCPQYIFGPALLYVDSITGAITEKD